MNINLFENKKYEEGTLGTAHDSSADADILQMKKKIEHRKAKQKKMKVLFFLLVLIILVLGALTGYSQYRLYKLSKEESMVGANTTSTPNQLPKTGEEVLAALSRHILVPQGNPQIAEVQDAIKLRDTQAFFKNVENGDLVIVYETTIFVYRPSQDIVVAAGDISGLGQVKP